MEVEIGNVIHYYDKAGVAIVALSGKLTKGSQILIKGKQTNFVQVAESLQMEHITVDSASAGDSIGLKVDKKVSEGDKVYKLL